MDRKQARAFEGFVYRDGTKGTDLYLSVTSRSTLPPNPYRRRTRRAGP